MPHAVEVEIEVDRPHARAELVEIEAVILVETESQKGILIGAGRMVKAIGIAARRAIERELGAHVHLELVGARAPSLARATSGCSTGWGSSRHRSTTLVQFWTDS